MRKKLILTSVIACFAQSSLAAMWAPVKIPEKPVSIILNEPTVTEDRKLNFSWFDAFSENSFKEFSFTLCREDTDKEKNCDELGTVLNNNNITVDGLILPALTSSYFLQSKNASSTEESASRIVTVPKSQVSKLLKKVEQGQPSGLFGTSIATSADGKIVAVGSEGEGAVYVYHLRDDGEWSEQRIPSPTTQKRYFGSSVAVSSSGTLAIGADAGGLGSYRGQVYIYSLNGDYWIESEVITSVDTKDFFGVSVALNDKGTRLAVGASGYQDIDGESGAVYIFDKSNKSSNGWDKYKISSPNSSYDSFGESVSLTEDTLLVGAKHHNDGEVHVYRWDGSNWQGNPILPQIGQPRHFGASVSLANDDLFVVGAPYSSDQSLDGGSVYLFKWNGTEWLESRILSSDSQKYDEFGHRVGVSAFGDLFAVTLKKNGEGSVHLYHRDGERWVENEILNGVERGIQGQISISKNGEVIAIGSTTESSTFYNSGVAYLGRLIKGKIL